MTAPRILYLTQHGLASPLGRAQCLPYLLRLARAGDARLRVVSFESDPLPTTAMRAEVADAGIEWIALRYHRSRAGLGTAFDIALGIGAALWLMLRHGADALHARSYVMAVIALMLHVAARRPFVFDMLGMLADEYADTGHWDRHGLRYRLTKRLESVLLRAADAVIVLTERNAEFLHGNRLIPRTTPITVIPCCVDLDRFSCRGTSGYPRAGAPRLVYAGSLGTWYMLDEMIAFYAAARAVTPDLRLRIVTRHDRSLVEAAVARAGLTQDGLEVMAADPDDVSGLLCESDVGLCFIAPMFSKHAASPNKLAEYLASGLPVLGTPGVGDVEETLAVNDVGVVVREHDPTTHREAWVAMERKLSAEAEELRRRCRAVATRDFPAELAVERYSLIYRAMTA